MAGHVEYCTVHDPPEGYKVYRSERGRHFWVTGNAEPTGRYAGAPEVDYKGKRAAAKKDVDPMDRLKRIFGEDTLKKKDE